MQSTQNSYNNGKLAKPFEMKSVSQILDDLAESRRQIEEGQDVDMEAALMQMGADHGFI